MSSPIPRATVHAWLQALLGLAPGQTPFPWQLALLESLRAGEIPAALDIPTGLGKTSVMAIWLAARACGAKLPRRLVYVVDRRAVVDQSTAEAERLRRTVNDFPDLRTALDIEVGQTLPISTLRGQFVDNREWLEDPSSPAVVLGTVDMVGSRLLFSGYGVSRKMRSYQAGLLGADTLLVIDEAHLVPAFERLVQQISSSRDVAGCPLGHRETSTVAVVPPLRVMSLSATGRSQELSNVVALTEADYAHPVVRKRIAARKSLVIAEPVEDKNLPKTMAQVAWDLAGQGQQPLRIVAFVTSRDQAQKTQAALEALARSAKQKVATELMVGGRRVHERQLAAGWLADCGFIPGSSIGLETASFLIATAAGEVGVDFDANHAVCDVVAWERMVQRWGRVNRRGEGQSKVVLVPTDTPKGDYHSAVMELIAALPHDPDGTANISIEALGALKEGPHGSNRIALASTPAPLHPPLTRAVVEAWSMTSVEEHAGRPEVAPWIRGWPEDPEEPQTSLAWRRLLPVNQDGRLLPHSDLDAFLDVASPHLAEKVETEARRAVDWLWKRVKALPDSRSEQEPLDRTVQQLSRNDALGVILGSAPRVVKAADLATKRGRDTLVREISGTTLLLDRRIGGLSKGLLDVQFGDPAEDVTEVVAEAEKREVPFRVSLLPASKSDYFPSVGWREEVRVPVTTVDQEVLEWLLVESVVYESAQSEEGRSTARRRQLLDEHEEWAEREATRLSNRLGLPSELSEMLATSARLHDEGKKAERWQRAFRAPNGGKPPLAKTTTRPNVHLLEGYRHELGSLPYAEVHQRVQQLPPPLLALCLHLIAAHHGGARPVLRTAGAPEPPSRLIQRAREIALRFSELEKTWGPWGLAWWEALLRAADQRASRMNDLEANRG